jgi:hypothetical protein
MTIDTKTNVVTPRGEKMILKCFLIGTFIGHSQGLYAGDRTPDESKAVLSEFSLPELPPESEFSLQFNASLSVDLSKVYFSRASIGWKKIQIFSSQARNGVWESAKPVSFHSDSRDTDPFLTADGKALLFASDRTAPGTQPNPFSYRLWRSSWVNGQWMPAEMLPQVINALAPILYPSMTRRGELFFSRLLDGKFLLYRAVGLPNGKFAAPERVLIPGAAWIQDPTVSLDGRELVFIALEALNADDPSATKERTLYVSRRHGSSWSVPLQIELPSALSGLLSTGLTPDGQFVVVSAKVGEGARRSYLIAVPAEKIASRTQDRIE